MSGKTSELIPVRKADIQLGIPWPWAVYTAERRLLLNKGVVVSTANLQLHTEGTWADDVYECVAELYLPRPVDPNAARRARARPMQTEKGRNPLSRR